MTFCAAQLFNYSMDQLSQRLTAAGLGSNLTLTSITPVSGYTLEAQLRALNGTSAGVSDGTAAPPFSEPAAAPSSESALSPPARYAHRSELFAPALDKAPASILHLDNSACSP